MSKFQTRTDFLFNDFAGNGETRLWKFLWWLLEENEEDRVAPLTSARKTYDKFFAYVQEDDEPSNRFGRGQPMPSVHAGWKPKPQFKLLGGGGNPKKMGPKTKAKESRDGNFF